MTDIELEKEIEYRKKIAEEFGESKPWGSNFTFCTEEGTPITISADSYYIVRDKVSFKELVKSKGLILRELAEKVGCTERAVDHWCAGRNVPSLVVAYYVACALGVTLEELAIIFLNQENGGKGNG